MKQRHALFVACLAVVVISAIICAMTGAISISNQELFAAVGHVFSSPAYQPNAPFNEGAGIILFDIRLPRIALAFIAGAALAPVGATMQAVFRNPMADPFVLGVSSGASVGAALAIVSGIAYSFSIGIMAFMGALTVIALLFGLAFWGRRFDQKTLLLAGIALQMIGMSMVSLLIALNRQDIENIVFWTMGSFNAATWPTVWVTLATVSAGMVVLMSMAKKMNIISLGNDTAHTLGINIKQTIWILLTVSALMIAFVVANAGVIGFVGLIVPHVGRMWLGPDNRLLLPFSALAGGWLVMVCDTLARTVIAPSELPVGCVTALIGAPYFLWMLLRHKKSTL